MLKNGLFQLFFSLIDRARRAEHFLYWWPFDLLHGLAARGP